MSQCNELKEIACLCDDNRSGTSHLFYTISVSINLTEPGQGPVY